jgi:hypothetical protein
MKNQKAVFVSGTEYTCTEFFDVDKQTGGIDIKDEQGNHVGEMLGEVIPDIDDEDENVNFDERVTKFIEEL